PHIIEGVEIYNNIVENTGWDGIQVSSAPVNCKIYNNIIRYDSYEEEPYQMSGILIGGGAKCDCYNNQIYDGKGDGIDIFGLGDMKIFNNLIVRAGRTFKPDDVNLFKHGIYVGELVTDPGATFKLYNNTIISPKSSGIKYANNDATMGYIKNNLITNPGQLQYNPNSAYLNISSDPQKVEISNNYNVPDNSTPKFVNYNSNDFDLKPDSPAVNYGTSLTNEGIIFDIKDRFRPFHTYFDAGAYECHDPYAALNENGELIGIPYPIPAKDYICIPVNSQLQNLTAVTIVSLEGKIIYSNAFSKSNIINNELIVSLNQVKTGKYILTITFDKHSINRPIIVIK
ncbi:MAG: right-handed parallel beta-helix repeat-containing protein, partial [Bacteroidetes bacterium]|nr:right-handed parallel beta-helix repeat-containing protein [Bacteroidota bacterium]